jgi:hypothetical protein
MPIFLFFFFYTSCYGSHLLCIPFLDQLQTKVARSLCMALTQKQELAQNVQSAGRNAFLNTHWIKGASYREPGVAYNNPQKSDVFSFPMHASTPITDFHEALSEKIIFSTKEWYRDSYWGIPDTLCGGIHRSLWSDNTLANPDRRDVSVLKISRSSFDKDIFPNFSQGHLLTFDGQTSFSIVLVTLYEDAHASVGKRPAMQKWFTPIEQMFFCKTLSDYKNGVAVLNDWSAYSRFALVVIPKRTKIRMHVGVAAPQSLLNKKVIEVGQIASATDYKGEVLRAVYDTVSKPVSYFQSPAGLKLSPQKLKEGLSNYCQSLAGGLTQVCLEQVEKYSIFSFAALYNRVGKPVFPCYLGQNSNYRWDPLVDPYHNSHFLANHNKIEVHPHKGLAALFHNGDFDEEEKEIQRVIDYVHG